VGEILTGLDCNEFVELVTAFLDGQLDDTTQRRLQEHLADCPGCERYLDQIRQTIAALRLLPNQRLSPAACQRLMTALREATLS
jgi:anti-sigma factor RsiW